MRKFLCIFIAILTLLTVPALAEENLLTNGDFSAGSGRFPDGWTTELWYTDEGVSVLDVEDGGYDGRCIRVSNLSDNDARFAQKVSVEPDTLYRISCMCRAEGIHIPTADRQIGRVDRQLLTLAAGDGFFRQEFLGMIQ